MRRILVVSPFVPYPADRGHRVRIFWLLRQLAEGYRVGLVTQCFDAAEHQAAAALRDAFPALDPVVAVASPAHRSLARRVAFAAGTRLAAAAGLFPRERLYHSSRALTHAVRRVVQEWRPDMVQGEYWFSRWSIPEGGFPVWIDTIDLHWLRLARAADSAAFLGRRIALRSEGRLIMRHELAAYGTAARLLAVQTVEAEILARRVPRAKVSVVPIACEVPPAPVRRSSGRWVLFLGAMDYLPNRDAVRFLAAHVMPEVMRLVPGTGLRVVGRTAGARALPREEWIHYCGHVAELGEAVDGVGVAVAPLRLGAGTSVKVPTLLGLGIPLVASPRAVEGLPLCPGTHYVAAEGPDDTARAIALLLNDEDGAAALGRRGHEAASHLFDWRRTTADVLRVYEEGLGA